MDIAYYNAHTYMHAHRSELYVSVMNDKWENATITDGINHIIMKRRYLGGITLL